VTGDTGTRALADGLPGHRLVRREDVAFADPYPGRGNGFQACRLVDGSTGATTESLVMRSRSGTVRRIHARHDRAKLRSY